MKEISNAGTIVVALLAVFLLGCDLVSPVEQTGRVEGRALYSVGSNHSGIRVTLEPIALEAQSQTVAGQLVKPMEELPSLLTARDGSYSFVDIHPGHYTLYASSSDSDEKAVSTEVSVVTGLAATADDLFLTPVGSVSGRVILDGTGTRNLGFLVFIAGTSFMAMTDDSGSFEITDVPVGTSYWLIVMKGTTQVSSGLVSVTVGETTTVDDFSVSFADIPTAESGNLVVWCGTLENPPADPNTNWAYHNSQDGNSYIWDGDSWEVLAAGGADGTQGPDGPPGTTLLYDDFERDTLTDTSEGFIWVEGSAGSIAINEGKLRLVGDGLGYITTAGLLPPNVPADFRLCLDTQWVSGSDTHSYGLIFRDTGSNSEYRFGLSAGGSYTFSSGTTPIVGWTASPAINQYGLNQLQVECVASSVCLYVNGVLLESLTDFDHTSGYIALYVGDVQAVEFDNLRLWTYETTSIGS